LSEEKEELSEQLDAINAELVDLLLTVDIIEDDISGKQAEIDQATVEYEEARQKEHDQQEAMKLRIKFMYEKGDSSYLEALVKSQNFSDLVNKSDYFEKLYAYDRELLEDYQKTKEEVLTLKTRLESEMADLEELHADYEEQSLTLSQKISEMQESVEGFDEELAAAQAKADEYKSEIKAQTNTIRQIEAEEEAARKAAEEARKKAEEEARKKAEEEARRKAEEEAKNKEEGSSKEQESEDNSDEEDEEEESSKKSYDNSPGNSSKGQEIANYALQFVGNPYVPGGTSLTEGCDCSGFTQAVYSHFGISLPRNSSSQSAVGRSVSYDSVQPGDILYYGGHVGIYIGNGQIVHASTQQTGIKVSNALYRSVISIRRLV
ncbi:MAG: C40 family peptidase, partial [Lachnospiraceae bacterium]|nr:C40 family peptidase [Lachnospiraceae bacterium]